MRNIASNKVLTFISLRRREDGAVLPFDLLNAPLDPVNVVSDLLNLKIHQLSLISPPPAKLILYSTVSVNVRFIFGFSVTLSSIFALSSILSVGVRSLLEESANEWSLSWQCRG